ncbi:MAG: class I SAM-dependent methyltransferase, partial [Bacilli bacterium]|nr:class I SAM-dependent methyltransferase [Bacilli bacterium]
AKKSGGPVHRGDARGLSLFSSDSFDVVLLFGPIYHLLKKEEKIQVLKEAKRVVKSGGVILTSYYMNDYAILTYGFLKQNIVDAKKHCQFDQDFHMLSVEGDLYSMVRIEDINEFNKELSFERIKIISSDGPANYMRTKLRELNDEEYQLFLDYHFATCERADLLGASSHLLDIVRVVK